MAVTTTPLGFQKPDGNESVRNGDNVISANAQKMEELVQADRGRLGSIEAKNLAQDNRLTAAESGLTSATSRVAAVESGNVTRDSRLTAAESTLTATATRVTAVESGNTARDGRITATESATTTQGTRLAGLESNDATQDAQLATVDGRQDTLSARIGQAEANISAGTGDGLGLSEDPENLGTYFMADITPTGPLQADPVTPGLYTF